MQLFALGLNHHSAPISIREQVAFQAERLDEALRDLTRQQAVHEAAILSTCNRTELYVAAESIDPVADWLARFHTLQLSQLGPFLYAHPHRDAVRHMFRVASGLDSMVLGEPQILGQFKEAARIADTAGTLGTTLGKLFQQTFSVAKEVRSTTAIGANIVSMAAAAVHLVERIFERVADQKVLFVGAGEMIELCASHFAGCRPKQMVIANRTISRAEDLAVRFGAQVVRLDHVSTILADFDVVVSCTGSPLPIIGLGAAETAVKLRRHRPMVMVDLAVPRDIEREVGELDDIFLYTVDDLSQIVASGVESRQAAVIEAEDIIDRRIQDFLHWLDVRDAVPTIRALREHAETVRLAELARVQKMVAKGASLDDVLEALSRGITNKLLHGPTRFLNDGEGLGQRSELVRELFRLDQKP